MMSQKFAFNTKKLFLVFLFLLFINSAISSERITVNGAGASSAKELFRIWSSLYEYSRAPFRNVELIYTPWGNDYGKEKLIKNINIFSISDVGFNQMELKKYPDLRSIPLIAT